MSRRVRLAAVIVGMGIGALSCGGTTSSGGVGGRKGVEGASCVKTDDCEAPLQCLAAVCMRLGAADAQGSDGAAPEVFVDIVSVDASAPPDVATEDPGLPDPGTINLDLAAEVLADWLEPQDPGPPADPGVKPLDGGEVGTFFEDCEAVGIAESWAGTFDGAVTYTTPLAIPGAPSQGTLPVAGTLSFDVKCIEKKLIVAGLMEGLALGQYPFTLKMSGTYNTKSKTLTANITEGKVVLFDVGIKVAVLFEGSMKGTLGTTGAFSGTWQGNSTGTDPAGIPGEATGSGTWTAKPN